MDMNFFLGRDQGIFNKDLAKHETELNEIVKNSTFLVVGAAGTIGRSVTNEIFKRNPKKLHVVDISENNLVELVRNIRSTIGYNSGEFKTFAVDFGGEIFEALVKAMGPYDYVFNLAALKHVRSEKDPYTLMRMSLVNIIHSYNLSKICYDMGASKYFCVSTDKAAGPANMMGASKSIMENFLLREDNLQITSMARFANVAFSDGSLLHGFLQRMQKRQPLSAPNDIVRYFVTPQESGELCMISGLLGKNRETYFPKISQNFDLIKFTDIAVRLLQHHGFEAYLCSSEEEARHSAEELIQNKLWPCNFFESDTTGEKPFEEFYTGDENVEFDKYHSLGIIKNCPNSNIGDLHTFKSSITKLLRMGVWTKPDLLQLYQRVLPDFKHVELHKYLDERM